MTELLIKKTDITTLDVDAVVNAANPSLRGGGGLDGAVHRTAGPELADYCLTLSDCIPGEARLTPGFNLIARHIIHTVGPIWHGGKRGEAQMLESCYTRSLSLALKHEIKTIAFPAISCGAHGYPFDAASKIAVDSVCNFIAEHDDFETIIFACFSDEMEAAYKKSLSARTL